MFDKTFFKFALGFSAIIIVGLSTLYLSGVINQARNGSGSDQAAASR